MRVICLIVALISAVTALPDGAPACIIGDSNVRNTHVALSRNAKKGTIAEGNYTVKLDGVSLVARSVIDPLRVNLFLAGVPHNLTVSSDKGATFRGVLVLFANKTIGTKLNLLATPGQVPPLEPALGCENSKIGAVSHSERSVKSKADMTLSYPDPAIDFVLDVNVVLFNNAQQGSKYFFTQYLLKSATQAEINPPVAPPTAKCGFFRKLFGLCK